MSLTIGNLDFEEEIADLADVFFLVMDFLNDSWIWCSDFGELLIRRNVCQLLELLDFITFLDVQFFDCAFLDFLSQVGEVELNDSEIEKGLENNVGFDDLLERSDH